MDTNILAHLLEIERKARNCGVSVDRVCTLAEINRSTWTRMKQGQIPRLDTWERILAVGKTLINMEAGT